MIFRAFLDGFGDNFSSNWNTFKYNGRGEDFFTYQGFKRTFNFNFKIAAQSRHEMMPLYRKLNFLVSNLAPDYSNTGRMRAPYIKLCIGAYMDRTPGILNSVNIKWNKNYPFEIALNSPESGNDRKMHVLPHVLDVSCQFTPIHNFVPRKSVESAPFIIPGYDSGLHIPDVTDRKWLSGNDSKWESEEIALEKSYEARISEMDGKIDIDPGATYRLEQLTGVRQLPTQDRMNKGTFNADMDLYKELQNNQDPNKINYNSNALGNNIT